MTPTRCRLRRRYDRLHKPGRPVRSRRSSSCPFSVPATSHARSAPHDGWRADNSCMDTLVTETHLRAGVAGLRAAGRGGLGVVAVGPSARAAGRWSRFARASAVVPDVLDDAVGFAAAVGRLAVEHGPLVVYPVQEEAIDALLEADLLAEAMLPYPAAHVVRRLRDKRACPGCSPKADFERLPRQPRAPLPSCSAHRFRIRACSSRPAGARAWAPPRRCAPRDTCMAS